MGATITNTSVSPAPNPYTSALTAPFNGTIPLATTYFNPQTFQIISSGIDGLYGVGGQYTPNVTGEALPLDPNFEQLCPVAARGQHHPGPRAGQHHQLP